MIALLRAVVDALHEFALVTFFFEYHGEFRELSPLHLGWGTLMFWVLDGRPLVGAQFCYGRLRVWLGPWYGGFPPYKSPGGW